MFLQASAITRTVLGGLTNYVECNNCLRFSGQCDICWVVV